MNRKMIVDFCNEEIFQKVDFRATMDMKEVVKMVIDFRRKNNYPRDMEVNVVDGFLYINNIAVGRIASKEPKAPYNEKGIYYEGRILARQENE